MILGLGCKNKYMIISYSGSSLFPRFQVKASYFPFLFDEHDGRGRFRVRLVDVALLNFFGRAGGNNLIDDSSVVLLLARRWLIDVATRAYPWYTVRCSWHRHLAHCLKCSVGVAINLAKVLARYTLFLSSHE